MPGRYSLKDVAEHSSRESHPWFIIKDKVYDITKLLDEVSLCSLLCAVTVSW